MTAIANQLGATRATTEQVSTTHLGNSTASPKQPCRVFQRPGLRGLREEEGTPRCVVDGRRKTPSPQSQGLRLLVDSNVPRGSDRDSARHPRGDSDGPSPAGLLRVLLLGVGLQGGVDLLPERLHLRRVGQTLGIWRRRLMSPPGRLPQRPPHPRRPPRPPQEHPHTGWPGAAAQRTAPAPRRPPNSCW